VKKALITITMALVIAIIAVILVVSYEASSESLETVQIKMENAGYRTRVSSEFEIEDSSDEGLLGRVSCWKKGESEGFLDVSSFDSVRNAMKYYFHVKAGYAEYIACYGTTAIVPKLKRIGKLVIECDDKGFADFKR
jgi:hypothetical protein